MRICCSINLDQAGWLIDLAIIANSVQYALIDFADDKRLDDFHSAYLQNGLELLRCIEGGYGIDANHLTVETLCPFLIFKPVGESNIVDKSGVSKAIALCEAILDENRGKLISKREIYWCVDFMQKICDVYLVEQAKIEK